MVPGIRWLRGQKELGAGGFLHWQFIVALSKKGSVRTLQGLYPGCHAELTRSVAAESYVFKEDTRVDGSQFEYGAKPIARASAKDWESIWELAKKGQIESIPADVRVSSYRTIRAIAADYAEPIPILRSCQVFWGATGTGKSRRAWQEASMCAYSKDPRSKFWCGYRGQENVVIDEFRGGIDIAHLLRWLDRYPCIVEIKGSSICLSAKSIWITSNLCPNDWYPDADEATRLALRRRLTVTQFHAPLMAL